MGFPAAPFPAEPLHGVTLVKRGKVRDVYDAGPGLLLLVASDRISAFDIVLSPGIPGKGVVLTQLSNFWFDLLHDVTPHHLVATRREEFPAPFRDVAALEGRAVLARAVRILPIECVVRGFLIGSGWKEYQARGSVCGIELPCGLRLADRLPEPVFTPSTKEEVGHDENISFDEVASRVGGSVAEELRDLSLRLYARAAAYAEQRGVIIADTGRNCTRTVWSGGTGRPSRASSYPPVESSGSRGRCTYSVSARGQTRPAPTTAPGATATTVDSPARASAHHRNANSNALASSTCMESTPAAGRKQLCCSESRGCANTNSI